MKNQSLAFRLKEVTKKHPAITIFCIAAGIITGAIYTYLTPQEYESTTVIAYTKPVGEQQIQTPFTSEQSAVTEQITSPSFIAKAITGKIDPVSYYITRDYQTRNNSQAFPYKIKHHILGQNFKEQHYSIDALNDNTYMLTSTVHGITRSKTAKFGVEVIDQDLALIITRKKNIPYQPKELLKPASFSFKIQTPETLAASLIEGSNDIEALDRNGVVTISCRYENSIMAQQITSAVAEQFLMLKESGSDLSTTVSLDKQLDEMSQQLEATETLIAQYKKENNITEMNFDTQKALDMLKNLQLQKSDLELNLAALNNTSNYLRKNREINNANVEYGTINDPVFSEQIAQLNSKYEAKEAGKATSPIDSEIEALKVSIAERILNTRKKTTVQINRINLEIASVNSQLATLPEKANTLNALDRKLALDKKVYDLLAEKRAQILVTGTTGNLSGGKILKPASGSAVPVYPSTWLILSLGLFAGFITSIPLNLIAEKLQSGRISNRKQLDNLTRIPFIGTITQNNSGKTGFEASISTLCTRVLLHPEAKLITFASSNKGEGKTFIATHFAQAFAAMDKKVLVIDMNSDNPQVAEHFNVTPERSLSEVLQGSCDIHDAICITSFPNLDVLLCGNLNAGVNSLLASNKRTSIMDSLKKHYDIIVTDTPDIGTQIDAIPIMKMSDLNLFVVNANTTRKDSLIVAEQIKTDYELNNIYFLLNSVKRSKNQHVGSSRRSRVRNLNKANAQPKEAYIPAMLRKIALWFY